MVSYLIILSFSVFLIISALNFQSKQTILEVDLYGVSKVEENLKNKFFYTIYYNFYDPFKTIFNKNKKISSPFSDEEYEFSLKNITLFSKVYDAHYRTAFKMFEDNILFGVGNKMYRKLCGDNKYYINKYGCSTHPHNLYLQMLSENGLIGFIFVLAVFIFISYTLLKEFILRSFYKKNILEDKNLLLTIGVFLNFWPIVPFGNFFNNWLSILIYLPIGFLLYFRANK